MYSQMSFLHELFTKDGYETNHKAKFIKFVVREEFVEDLLVMNLNELLG